MIALIDYGLGNINAFANIYTRLNIPFKFARTAEDLENSSHLILPGVGTFDYAMEKIEASGMRTKLDQLVLKKKLPILGVCVGMQINALFAFTLMILFNTFGIISLNVGLHYLFEIQRLKLAISDEFEELNGCLDSYEISLE